MARPRKPNGDEVNNKLFHGNYCNCGHMQLIHTARFQEGHGSCVVNRCRCSQFTYSGVGRPHNIDTSKTFEFSPEDWHAIDRAVNEVEL